MFKLKKPGSDQDLKGHFHQTIFLIKEAIKQRQVDPDQVILYEQLGFCFGRVRQEFQAEFEKVTGPIDRIY